MKAQSAADDRGAKLKANDDLNEYTRALAKAEHEKRRRLGNLLLEDPNRVGMRVKELSFSGYERNPVFYNTGGSYADIGGAVGGALLDDGRGVVAADFDGDGDEDLAVHNVFVPQLVFLRNDVAREPGLEVHLRGAKTNRFGIGARVTVTTGRTKRAIEILCGTGYLSGNAPHAFFGLGGERVTVEVKWPTGERQTFKEVGPGRLVIEEGKGTRHEPFARVDAPAPPAPAALLRAGDPAAIKLVGLDRASFDLKAHKGRTLLYQFWTVRCPSCADEVRALSTYRELLRAAGVELISINLDGSPEAIQGWEPAGGWPARVWLVEEGAEGYLPAAEPVMPLHVLVGGDGRIVDRLIGGRTPQDLAAEVRRLLTK